MNAANVLVTILNSSNALVGTLNVGIGLVNAIRGIFANSDQPYTIVVQAIDDGALKTVAETEAIMDAWDAAHPPAG